MAVSALSLFSLSIRDEGTVGEAVSTLGVVLRSTGAGQGPPASATEAAAATEGEEAGFFFFSTLLSTGVGLLPEKGQ